jgi:hypothetical protein
MIASVTIPDFWVGLIIGVLIPFGLLFLSLLVYGIYQGLHQR